MLRLSLPPCPERPGGILFLRSEDELKVISAFNCITSALYSRLLKN